MSSKGQFFSYDAIAAGAIFVLALSLLMTYWLSTSGGTGADYSRESFRIAETLLTPGSPADWESGAPKIIGIVEKPNSKEISPEKLSKFREIAGEDYEALKPILVVETEYWIEFSGENIDCSGSCSFGKKPPGGSEIFSTTRLVVMNGKPAALRVVLWKP